MTRMRVLLGVVALTVAVGGGTASPGQAMPPYKVASHCQALINSQIERGIIDADGNARIGCANAFSH